MRLAKAKVFTGAVLVSWACAKTNTPDPGSDSYTPVGTGAHGGTLARAGSGGTAQSGVGGSATASGGTGASGGTNTSGGTGAAGTGGGGAGGVSAIGGMGGTTTGAGRDGSGGSVTAGRSGTGGTNATGGVANVGGNGGVGPAPGGATNGGRTGAAGMPSDPNWKPPDMTATAELLVLYVAAVKDASAQDLRMTLTMKNQTDTPYDVSGFTMRYWMSSEPPPKPQFDYVSDGLSLSKTLQFVANDANSYLLFTFGKGGVVPPFTDPNAQNEDQIQGRVESGIGSVKFNQSNDWSFDATAATTAKPNPKMTIYDAKGTLIWGCEPSHLCAGPPSTGEAGGGGQGGI